MTLRSFENLRVAVLGCGRMGRLRLAALERMSVQVLGVHDPAPSAIAEGAPGHPVLASIADLPLANLDAVFLCTPPDRRSEVEAACIEAGVAFFAEKPLGPNAKAGLETLALLRRKPVITAVGYMNRYRASVNAVRAIARKERVLGLSAKWLGGAYARDWWQDSARSGGPVNEQATHLVDLVRYLGGEVAEVAALGDTEHGRNCSVAMTLESGARATLLYSCEATTKSISMELVTTQGTQRLDGWAFADPSAPEDPDPNEIFAVETEAFLKAVAEQEASLIGCDYGEALRTQRVVDAVHESMRAGATVRPEGL